MDGKEFLNVAIRLSASRHEGDLRSAVSRAYYGAFHTARELVESCGVRLPKAAQAHERLQWCLGQCDEEAALLVHDKLNSLRTDRNLADYDLNASKFRDAQNVRIQLRIAQAIVDGVGHCRLEPTFSRIRETIRPYAKTIGLPVSDD